MRLQQGLELLQLRVFDQPVKVHFFQDVVGRKLLASFVLVQGREHSTSLLT